MAGDAAAVRRFRARQNGTLQPLPVCPCGRRIVAPGRSICSRCWQQTPDYLAVRNERRRQRRQADRMGYNL